jgi:hypothetical protein
LCRFPNLSAPPTLLAFKRTDFKAPIDFDFVPFLMIRLADERRWSVNYKCVSTSTSSLAHDIAVGRVGKAKDAYAICEPMAQ